MDGVERDGGTGGPPQRGARLVAIDPRTGIEVVGAVEEAGTDDVEVDPLGEGYPPGAFTAERGDVVEVLGRAGTDVGPRETRKRKEWDITAMCLSGALGELEDSTIDMVSSSIAEGHL